MASKSAGRGRAKTKRTGRASTGRASGAKRSAANQRGAATTRAHGGKRAASTRRAHGKRTASTKRVSARGNATGKRWSAGVTRTSDALDLREGIFKQRSAKQIALSLKRSAEASQRRKAGPYQSAMSMLNFEINRAGKGLSAERRRTLNNAKAELRKAFHREPA